MGYYLTLNTSCSILFLILFSIPSSSFILPHSRIASSSVLTSSSHRLSSINYRNDKKLISYTNQSPRFLSSLSSSTVSLDPKDPILNLDVPPYRKKEASDDFLIKSEPLYSKINRKRILSISCLVSMFLFYVCNVNHLIVRLFTGLGLTWIGKEIWWKTFDISNATRKESIRVSAIEDEKPPLFHYLLHVPFILTTAYFLYSIAALVLTKVVTLFL